jgi:hypothetical protein
MSARPARAAGGRLLAVRVSPGAGRREIVGFAGDVLRVRVTEAPEGGRANRAVQALLAEALGVPPAAVELARGGASRDKLFRVGALSIAEVRARLEGARP